MAPQGPYRLGASVICSFGRIKVGPKYETTTFEQPSGEEVTAFGVRQFRPFGGENVFDLVASCAPVRRGLANPIETRFV